MSETIGDLCCKLRDSGECTQAELIMVHGRVLCTAIDSCEVLQQGIRKYWDKEDDTRDES